MERLTVTVGRHTTPRSCCRCKSSSVNDLDVNVNKRNHGTRISGTVPRWHVIPVERKLNILRTDNRTPKLKTTCHSLFNFVAPTKLPVRVTLKPPP